MIRRHRGETLLLPVTSGRFLDTFLLARWLPKATLFTFISPLKLSPMHRIDVRHLGRQKPSGARSKAESREPGEGERVESTFYLMAGAGLLW